MSTFVRDHLNTALRLHEGHCCKEDGLQVQSGTRKREGGGGGGGERRLLLSPPLTSVIGWDLEK